MPLRVNDKHPNTIEFLKYVVGQITKKKDLKQYDGVEVRIEKGKTPFPEFQHYSRKQSVEEKASAMILKNSSDYDEKVDFLGRYLIASFGQSAEIALPIREKGKSLIFVLWIVVKIPFEIYRLHEQLKAIKPKKKVLEKPMVDEESQLKTNPLRIVFWGKEIAVQESTIQSDICSFMFSKPLNTKVELDEIVDKVYGTDVENPKEKLKSITNAFYLLNKRVKDQTKYPLFSFGKKRFSRIA